MVVSGSVLVRSPSITAAATTMIIVTLTEHKNRVKVVVPGRGAEELELGCWCNYERRRAQVLSPAWPPLLLLSTKFCDVDIEQYIYYIFASSSYALILIFLLRMIVHHCTPATTQ